MKSISTFTCLFMGLLATSTVAQDKAATPPPPLSPNAPRVSFMLKNTLGYHRMFRAYGPGIAYGFTMGKRETTPKNWPVGTSLYFSPDGETTGPLILTVTADDEGKTLTTGSQPTGSLPALTHKKNNPGAATAKRPAKSGGFGFNALSSVTTIPPSRTFELGGNHNGSFTARVKNVGSGSVAVSQRQADGQTTDLGQLRPDEKKTLHFVAGATAVFVNPASISAELALEVTGDTSLKMGYAKE